MKWYHLTNVINRAKQVCDDDPRDLHSYEAILYDVIQEAKNINEDQMNHIVRDATRVYNDRLGRIECRMVLYRFITWFNIRQEQDEREREEARKRNQERGRTL